MNGQSKSGGRGVAAWTIALLSGLLLAMALLPRASEAQTVDNRVGLVVKFSSGAVFTGCYAYRPGMTGLDLLRDAGLDAAIEYSNLGAFVCRLGATGFGADGCSYPSEDCLCQARTRPWRYWAYWRLDGAAWAYSDRGAAGRALAPGSVDGWAWGEGSAQMGERPPLVAFHDICLPPTATPPPTATHIPPPPPTLAPDTPTATHTLVPPSLTPTLTPVVAQEATPTFTPAPVGDTATPEPTPVPTLAPVETATLAPEPSLTPVVPLPPVATATPAALPATPTPPPPASPTPGPTLTPTQTQGLPATATAPPQATTGLPATATALPGPPVSPTIHKGQAGTLTPVATGFAGRVDLSALTPAPPAQTGRQSPDLPFSYGIFAALALGLVTWLMAHQRGQ